MTWWRDGVLYQVYPRSFADADGDGHGDLRGLIDRLDHLEWLGVSGIWLNPTFPSPNEDWGYDVSDYYGVHPDFGTLADLDELVVQARARGIRVLLDLVPNHTSDRHPWFTERPDYYTWADGDAPPNNWRSIFDGGPAWTRHANGRWYLRLFLPSQPDLNWWNPDVADEFDAIVRFWLDRGISGFRIDVCQAIVKDRLLRDDPGRSYNQPEVHDVMRRWRRLADGYDEAMLVGETYVFELDQLVDYYGDGTDELHLGFNIPFLKSDLAAEPMRAIVEAMEEKLPAAAWPVWTGSNHDAGRLATRWAGDDPARARCALMMLLTLRGTPFLYYGDEIGLRDVPVAGDAVRDHADHRDHCRTPMPWDEDAWRDPWLPLGGGTTVAAQREDPSSTLHLVRDLIALRRAFVSEPYATLPAPEGAWAYARGDFAVALNLAEAPLRVEDLDGEVAIGTDRGRDGASFDGRLGSGEAVVVRRSPRRAGG
jgi:alpha-glucosidase